MSEPRFAFGANWRRFLELVDEPRILSAEAALADRLERPRLDGLTLLDAGSGSGLMSLAARRLGARVRSFDLDPDSVAATSELRARHRPGDPDWQVERGSVLDRPWLLELGRFDIVYSWGVLHHTGALWQALGNVCELVAPGGSLYVAIYNDQGRASLWWTRVKRLYNRLPRGLRWLVLGPAFLRLWGPTVLRDTLRLRPLATWGSKASRARGMSPWHDLLDWVGGYPFEVAKPEQVFDFARARGFVLTRLRTAGGGLGCNELVFRRERDVGDNEVPAEAPPSP